MTELDGFDTDPVTPDAAAARAAFAPKDRDPRQPGPTSPNALVAGAHVMGALGALEGALHLLKNGQLNLDALSNLFGASVVMISEAVSEVGLSFESLLGARDEQEPPAPVVDSRE